MPRKSMFVLILIMFIGCSLFTGCSKYRYVLVPPAVDLISHGNIGLISFSTENAEGELNEIATQRFLQIVTQSQRGVQLIELGNLDEIMKKIGKTRLDQETVKAIGQYFNVTAVFSGKINISDVKPQVSLDTLIKSLGVSATFNITLTSRFYSTETGATLWTNSVYRKDSLANMSMIEGGIPSFNVKDEEETYKVLIQDMIYLMTRDFRQTEQRVKVTKY